VSIGNSLNFFCDSHNFLVLKLSINLFAPASVSAFNPVLITIYQPDNVFSIMNPL
jgi:hypothetical protein